MDRMVESSRAERSRREAARAVAGLQMACHSEQSEESSSGHAARQRCEGSIGSFAALSRNDAVGLQITGENESTARWSGFVLKPLRMARWYVSRLGTGGYTPTALFRLGMTGRMESEDTL
jgi:hypothetical protein